MEDLVDFFSRTYAGKRILVTGHTGFKGSWASLLFAKFGAELYGYSLDKNQDFLAYHKMGVSKLYTKEFFADIADNSGSPNSFQRVLEQTQPDVIFHFAAQPLVLDSYRNPEGTLHDNIVGAIRVLEAVRTYGKPVVLIMVTSDKCYDNREIEKGYSEDDAMGGKDIYSASKACVELLTRSYRESFFPSDKIEEHGIRVASVRAGNVIGGGDLAKDRLIPDLVRSLMGGEKLKLRNPHSVRPWQHVLEPLFGYLELASLLLDLEQSRNWPQFCSPWNFGPPHQDRSTVEDLVKQFLRIWGAENKAVEFISGDYKEASTLRLSIEKASTHLRWRPRWGIEQSLEATATWYKNACFETESDRQILEYTQNQIQHYINSL